MNLMTKELATINFFIIWVIIFGGLLFLRIVKTRLEIQITIQPGLTSLWVPSENFNGGKDERPNPEFIKGGENGRSKKNGIQPGEGSDVDACFDQCVFPLDAGYETFLAGNRISLLLDELR